MAITCCWVCHHVQNCEAMLGWSSESTNLSEESKEQPHMGFVLSWAKDNERTCGPSGPNKTRTASNKHVWIYLFYMWPRDTGVRVCVHKDKCVHVVSACVYVALVKKKEKILHKPFRLSLLFCEIPRKKKSNLLQRPTHPNPSVHVNRRASPFSPKCNLRKQDQLVTWMDPIRSWPSESICSKRKDG